MKTGIFGIGQCGGNIIYKAVVTDKQLQQKIENYDPFIADALNSTGFDTKQLEAVGVQTRIIGNEEDTKEEIGGSAKMRSVSKKTFKKYGKDAIMDMAKKFEDCQAIVGFTSCGGGTGAGQAPMVMALLKAQLTALDKEKETKRKRAFIVYGITPANNEDLKAMKNCLETVEEMKSLGIVYILLDNEKVQSQSIKTVYESINSSAVDDLRVIRGDFNSKPSIYGNMDFGDCMSLFSTPGRMSINKITGIKETDLDNNSIDSLILKSIKESYNVQLEKDKILGKVGIILSVTESMLEKFNRNLDELFAEIGTTTTKFLHVNIVEDEEQTSIITILSGLSCPDSRLSEYADIISSAKEAVTKEKESKLEELNNSTEWFMDDDDNDESDDEPESMEDIMSKF